MYSIAALCKLKDWSFRYICKTIPTHLKDSPTGNFKEALEMGMIVEEVHPDSFDDRVELLRDGDSLVIPQGGASISAKAGIEILASEVVEFAQKNNLSNLNVITPSGTGTTALFLASSLPQMQIVTSPAVGSVEYLKKQMQNLQPMPSNLTIIKSKTEYRFATPHKDLLECYSMFMDLGVEFDLIYAPQMWIALFENLTKFSGDILYVHSGGISGNKTMLDRYSYTLN